MGIEKCKVRARQVVFWPGINAEITEMISRCPACIKYQQAQKKQPLKPHDVPAEPWYKVGMDLATYKNKDYLVIVDYFYNYPEVCPLNNTRSSTIISHVKSIFSRHGIPKIVISDNGPQFSSLEFKQFATKWEFTHTTSIPEYPRSNGMAESTVKIVKKIFKRTECMDDDAYLALLAHRATPSTNDTRSPAEKLMGRNIRTPLPDLRKMVYGKKDCRDTELPVKFNPAYKRKRKQYYDRPTNQLPEVPVESTVRIRDKEKGTWPLKAKVLGNANTPRSLFVESEKGSTLRRNRQDLLITNEKFAPQPDTEDIPDEPAGVSGNNANHDEIQQSKLPTTTGENAEPNTIQDDVLTNRNNSRRSLRLSRPPNRFGFDD